MDARYFFETYAPHATTQQQAAITRVNGPTLLLAVPGSGKTTTLVQRQGYMTQCAGIHPRQMLTLTFSRMAAAQMRRRYADAFGSAHMPHFSTIHSFCVQVLRQHHDVCMIEEQERDRLLRSLYWQHSGNADQFSENAIRQIDAGISYAKNRLLDQEGIRALTHIDEDFPAIFHAYEQALVREGKMDFDDQLVAAYRLLLDNPAILHTLQQTYRYISVDEAQDTSYVQHRILYLLARGHWNIFMVGDEDQSIYGFRAAYPDVLLDFARSYPGASVLLMEQNFRSTPQIVRASNALIRHAIKRNQKTAVAARQSGKPILVTTLADASLQYAYIADSLERRMTSGMTQAVLYRNNESALPLIDLLQRRKLPFACRDTAAAAVGSSYMQQVLALLEFSLFPADVELYARLYHKLGLYTTRETLQKVQQRANGRRPCLDILADIELTQNQNPRAATAAEQLHKRLGFLRDMQPQLAVSEACAVLRAKRPTESEAALLPKADILRAIAQLCGSVEGFLERMRELAGFGAAHTQDGITLSTLHSAKGLEFDRVLLIDAYEGILPMRSDSPAGQREKELEEELRLFYVGVTRARDELELLIARRSFGEPLSASRFIGWLDPAVTPQRQPGADARPADLAMFSPGARVVHARFGPGVIAHRNGEVACITFAAGRKNIHLPTCCAGGILTSE